MRTIKSKLLLTVIVPVISFTVCSFVIFVTGNIHQINTAGYRSAMSLAKATTQNVDSWLKVKKGIISGYYGLDTEFLKSTLQTGLPIKVDSVYDLYYGDPEGKTYAGLDSVENYLKSGYDPRKRPWYIASKAKPGEVVISEPYLDTTTSDLVLTISEGYPAADKGVVGLDLSIDDVTGIISSLNLPVEGEAYLVFDEDNRIIVSSTGEPLLNRTLQSVYRELSPEVISRTTEKEKMDQSFSSISLDRGDVFVLSEKLNEAPWKIVIILDKNSYLSIAHIYIAVVSVLSLLVLLGTIIYIARAVESNIVKPVHHVGSMLRDLAEKEPDFNNKIDVQSDDEIGELAYNFNLLLDNQKLLFNKINGFLKTSTRDSINSNESISNQINEQQNELNEVISSVEQLNGSITNIDHCVVETEEIAGSIGDASREGKKMVEQSSDSIRELSDSIRRTGDAIATVSECANSIFSVVGSIKEIADQTNLLALNAAIESARAGEHGRGFAVVADEVRSLAIKTGESASSVQDSIKTLQNHVNTTVTLMQQSMNDCESSMNCVNTMNESINTILNTVTRISTNTEAIRNVTSDQSRLIDDTSDKILKVNDSNSSIIRTISENKEKTISLRKKAEEIAVEIGTN